MLVSILIPAYKAEAYIAETIASACDQTWPKKEVIVVDDGSPDQTFEVARRFESANVKVVRQENSGAPSARNKALSLAQGEYIQWLDADDLLHPEKIRRQLEGAESGLSSLTMLTAAWAHFFFQPERAEFKPDGLWRDHAPLDWLLTKFNENVYMNPAVWLVSRKLTELAGPWDVRLGRSGDDDGEYVCRVIKHATHVRFVGGARAYYRIGNVGGLNWSMWVDDGRLQSLALSLKTTAGHLLELEDSDRTRQAVGKYFAAFGEYFYGSDGRSFNELIEFARGLGVTVEPPRANWKYLPFEALLGPRVTRKLIVNWRTAKLLMRRKLELRASPSAGELGLLPNQAGTANER